MADKNAQPGKEEKGKTVPPVVPTPGKTPPPVVPPTTTPVKTDDS